MLVSRSTVRSTNTSSDISNQQVRLKASKHEDVTAALIHPGWVQTDLGDEIKGWMETYAKNVPHITTAQSSAGVLAVEKNVTIDSAASFYNYDGSKLLSERT